MMLNETFRCGAGVARWMMVMLALLPQVLSRSLQGVHDEGCLPSGFLNGLLRGFPNGFLTGFQSGLLGGFLGGVSWVDFGVIWG